MQSEVYNGINSALIMNQNFPSYENQDAKIVDKDDMKCLENTCAHDMIKNYFKENVF